MDSHAHAGDRTSSSAGQSVRRLRPRQPLALGDTLRASGACPAALSSCSIRKASVDRVLVMVFRRTYVSLVGWEMFGGIVLKPQTGDGLWNLVYRQNQTLRHYPIWEVTDAAGSSRKCAKVYICSTTRLFFCKSTFSCHSESEATPRMPRLYFFAMVQSSQC